jgi:hypothetical protein
LKPKVLHRPSRRISGMSDADARSSMSATIADRCSRSIFCPRSSRSFTAENAAVPSATAHRAATLSMETR